MFAATSKGNAVEGNELSLHRKASSKIPNNAVNANDGRPGMPGKHSNRVLEPLPTSTRSGPIEKCPGDTSKSGALLRRDKQETEANISSAIIAEPSTEDDATEENTVRGGDNVGEDAAGEGKGPRESSTETDGEEEEQLEENNK
ncbi:hypothetical protein NDU88_001124 [Pleurodeles waltl]|uniref:Uncharacterized protein n=1 Tax=Pleurodeles waltl TaxID=8319 RepID=A0AAV7NES8_PLEWA|nr:hypothetical protein NDU88_001124 [Pleurodeles waltl]